VRNGRRNARPPGRSGASGSGDGSPFAEAASLPVEAASRALLLANTTVQQFLAGINTLFAGWDQKVRSAIPRPQSGGCMSRRSGSVFLKLAGNEVGVQACSCPCEWVHAPGTDPSVLLGIREPRWVADLDAMADSWPADHGGKGAPLTLCPRPLQLPEGDRTYPTRTARCAIHLPEDGLSCRRVLAFTFR
jgi:hypothetical protein